MKRIFLVLVTIMFVASAFAQNNNLFWTMRVKVKMDKKLEWEKKAPLLMKTHYPQFTFRVYEVTTGENTGSYVLSIGPMSYKDLDVPPVFPKGEAALKTDGQALDAISESLEVTHYKRMDAISSIKMDRNNKYAKINFFEINIGSWQEIESLLAKMKQVREKNDLKMDVSYFRPVNSGAMNKFAAVTYMEKMADLDKEVKFAEMYDEMHGSDAWYKDSQNYLSKIKSNYIELWVLRQDLSTTKPVAVSTK
jgi:hypothetical protein